MRPTRKIAALAVFALLSAEAILMAAPAGAVMAPGPSQADCDNGSVSVTWAQTGIGSRPTLVSAVIGGEVVDPARLAAPLEGEIGVAICSQDAQFAKNSSINFIKRSGGYTSDLTGARTPGGIVVDASTPITIVVELNDLSPYFSFATAFANVDAWSLAGGRSTRATLTATLRATDTVAVNGDIPEEQGCTRQPPECLAPKADLEYFGLSMQLKSERDNDQFASLTGGYFALRNAIGGYVRPDGSSVAVTLGGPHFKADGSTLNIGSMTAFLPDAALRSWFGLVGTDVTSSTFDITRTEGGATAAAPWTYRAIAGGIAIDVADIGFSSPLYRISSNGSGSKANDAANRPRLADKPAFFSAKRSGRRVTAKFAGAPRARYQVVMTNGRTTYVSELRSKSTRRWMARSVSRRLTKGTWVIYVRQRVGKGFGDTAAAVVKVGSR